MESSPESSLSPANLQKQDIKHVPSENRTLKVDFSWKKLKALVTEEGDSRSEPVYVVGYNLSKPHLLFKSASDDIVVGSSNLHAISIDADCEVLGQPITLKAMKRFKTQYSHLSHAFSDTDTPVRMAWTSSSDFKVWDFVCLDELQNPVAKFSANIWAVTKVGKIEFLGPKAATDAARQEIVVVGLTLFYLMLLRMNNILSFFGAIFSQPGHNDEINTNDAAGQAVKKDNMLD